MKRDLLVAVLGVALLATVAGLRAQQPPAGGGRAGAIPGNSGAEPCTNSPICAWGLERNLITHELRTADMGFTFAYPFASLKAAAVSRRSRSIRKDTCTPFSGMPTANRSCSSSTRTTS